MKKRLLASLFSAFVLASSVSLAGETGIVEPGLEKKLVKICKALQSNKTMRLREAVKHARLKYSAVHKGLVCNGQNALAYAQSQGANKTALLLAKRSGLDLAMVAKR